SPQQQWTTTRFHRTQFNRPASGALPEWFIFVLGRDAKLYAVDLRERATRVICRDSHNRSIALLPSAQTQPASAYLYRLGIRTDDAVLLVDEHGATMSRYAIPQPLRERSFSFAETKKRQGVFQAKDEDDDGAGSDVLFWVGEDNAIREQR